MALIHDQLSKQFYQWEKRGRGWQVFDYPVSPEPPFRPFRGHYLPPAPAVDDGCRSTFISSFMARLSQKLSTQPPSAPPIPEPEAEPEPDPLIRDALVELQTTLPNALNLTREAFEHFLSNLSLCREPIAFELLGVPECVRMQFAAHPSDAPLVRRQLQAHFPEGVFQAKTGTLEEAWDDCAGEDALVVEFGLAREFMVTLVPGKLDPFIGLVGALSELGVGELGLFQVLFQPIRNPWPESILGSVTHSDGKPFFVNAPELVAAAEKKICRPLYAAVVRIAIRSDSFERTMQLACDLAGALRVFNQPQGNELIPLQNSAYPFDEHVEDTLRRQSRRSGMILNSDELTGFVHLPTSAVRSPVFERDTDKSKAAPALLRRSSGLLLGHNVHGGKSVPVRLTPEERVRHMHVVGVQGTGKSTLLFNLIRQDIEQGAGLAVLDPHGDLIDQILGIIPPERIEDVVLVDPSDEQYSVGFNILSAHSDAEKRLLSSDLVSVFQRLSTSWGDQMGSVLQNAILAFLESSMGGTLADLRRFLLEPAYRHEFLTTVRDPNIVYYWRKGFVQLAGNKSIGSVITRLNDFLAPKPIRYMVSQPVNRLDFGQMLDTGKIFLAKLPQGEIGKENSFLLGSLIVAKFQQMVMARQAQRIAQRKDFWLYIDEFHNFMTPSMAEILTGARKYRLGLILAHQELRQLERDREVASAVLSMPYTRVAFRVGDADARTLEDGFSFFEAKDLQNLEIGQTICRVEKSDHDFNLSVQFPDAIDPATAEATRHAVIAASRAKYASPRAEVEAAEEAKFKLDIAESAPVKTKATPLQPEKPSEPKAVESPTPTVSEKEIFPKPLVAESNVVIPDKPVTVSKSSPPRDLGRGGSQHKAIQLRIKEAADRLGFLSLIEKQVLDGAGSVDLFLERAGISIACEISISTTIDHEVGNVAKCLKAAVTKVAVICLEQERLQKIEAGVLGSLGIEKARQVAYFQPDQFIAHLKTLPQEATVEPNIVRRGYRIKRVVSPVTAEKQKEMEEAAIRAIADSMRKK